MTAKTSPTPKRSKPPKATGNTAGSAPADPPTGPVDRDGQPEVAGEGNVSAARRHRQSVERFVDDGRVGPAADDAAPADAAEADELKRAEDEGRSHAKR
jgi:hypothetical protein